MRRNHPYGNNPSLGERFDALAAELRQDAQRASGARENTAAATGSLGQLRQAALALRQATASTRQLAQAVTQGAHSPPRTAAACPGGTCPAGSGGTAVAAGGGAGALSGALSSGLNSALRSALGGDFQRALQSMLSSVVRSISSSIGRGVGGGGLGGSLVSTLVGTGLSLLLGKLFRKRQSVQVENTVQSEVLNFPRLLSLDYASNPASRLFGGRAVPRGAAFSVEVSYKGGAEELVTAKVASRLAELNLLHGL